MAKEARELEQAFLDTHLADDTGANLTQTGCIPWNQQACKKNNEIVKWLKSEQVLQPHASHDAGGHLPKRR